MPGYHVTILKKLNYETQRLRRRGPRSGGWLRSCLRERLDPEHGHIHFRTRDIFVVCKLARVEKGPVGGI